MALGSFAHIGTTGGMQISRHLFVGGVVPHPLQVSPTRGNPVAFSSFHTFPKPTAPHIAEALEFNAIYPGYYLQSK